MQLYDKLEKLFEYLFRETDYTMHELLHVNQDYNALSECVHEVTILISYISHPYSRHIIISDNFMGVDIIDQMRMIDQMYNKFKDKVYSRIILNNPDKNDVTATPKLAFVKSAMIYGLDVVELETMLH